MHARQSPLRARTGFINRLFCKKKKKSLSFHEISHTSLYLFPLRFVCSGKALLFHINTMRKRENFAFRGSVVNIKNEGAFSKNNRIYPQTLATGCSPPSHRVAIAPPTPHALRAVLVPTRESPSCLVVACPSPVTTDVVRPLPILRCPSLCRHCSTSIPRIVGKGECRGKDGGAQIRRPPSSEVAAARGCGGLCPLERLGAGGKDGGVRIHHLPSSGATARRRIDLVASITGNGLAGAGAPAARGSACFHPRERWRWAYAGGSGSTGNTSICLLPPLGAAAAGLYRREREHRQHIDLPAFALETGGGGLSKVQNNCHMFLLA